MTDWELQDFAVRVIRDMLRAEGRDVRSSAGDLGVNPSIWFVGDEGLEWVIVRAVRDPAPKAAPPANWAEIARRCARVGRKGHFASLVVRSANGPRGPAFLARGYGCHVAFDGFEPGPEFCAS